MNKDTKINIRSTKKEKTQSENKANKCNMTISKFILNSCLRDNIVIINGLDKFDTELRRIGNNINQLTKLCNQGRITNINLEDAKKEMKSIWQLLNLLIQNQN